MRRPAEDGGDCTFTSYEQLEAAFVSKNVHPMDLKKAVATAINDILAPIRDKMSSPAMQALISNAYPPVSRVTQCLSPLPSRTYT